MNIKDLSGSLLIGPHQHVLFAVVQYHWGEGGGRTSTTVQIRGVAINWPIQILMPSVSNICHPHMI